jgi:molecular chaperone DnaK (HSP70)
MAAEGAPAAPGARHAIGISFGNSNSSIAITSVDDKAEVIANEDGGMCKPYWLSLIFLDRVTKVRQIVKSLRFCLMLMAKNITANKLSNN